MNGERTSEMYRKIAGCIEDRGSSGSSIRRRRETRGCVLFQRSYGVLPVIALVVLVFVITYHCKQKFVFIVRDAATS